MRETERQRGRQSNFSLHPLGKEQPNQSRTGPDLITQPSVAWSDAYLDKHAARTESATCSHTPTRRDTVKDPQIACANTNDNQNNQQTRMFGFSYMAEGHAMTHTQCNRQTNDSDNKSVTNTVAQVVVFLHVLNSCM